MGGVAGWYTTPDPQFRVDPGTAYTLRVTRTDHATGHYHFVVVTAKENRTLISLAGTTPHRVAGDLESRGRVDIYRFQARSPAGCTSPAVPPPPSPWA